MTARGFSVVIPTHNRPALLLRAIDSVLTQERVADEIIVVDNGTLRVQADRLPSGVHLIEAPANIGASQARNIGVSAATGAFIAFLDDDDRWMPQYLAAVAGASASHPNAGLFVGALHVELNSGTMPWKVPRALPATTSLLRRNPGVGGTNLTVRRSVFLELGGFDAQLPASEDVDFLIRASQARAEIVFVEQAIALFTNNSDGPRLTNLPTLMTGKWRFLAKHVANPVLRAALFSDYAARVGLAQARQRFQR